MNFNGFWSRRLQEGEDTAPWIFGGEEKATPITGSRISNPFEINGNLGYFQNIIFDSNVMEKRETCDDLRDVIRVKAEKHKHYYERLVGTDNTHRLTLDASREMARAVSQTAELNQAIIFSSESEDAEEAGSQGSVNKRQRKQGVYEISGVVDEERTIFKSVKQLRDNYLAMLEKTSKNLSLAEKEPALQEKEKFDLLAPPPSGYCSSTASAGSDDEREKSWFQKNAVRRSGSSDSAVHSDEDVVSSNWGEKKEENLNESYVPRSPYSPRGSIDHSNVPSKTLIEAQYVPYPIDRKFSVDCVSDICPDGRVIDSRRQSCFSEGDEQMRYRYWRTPSVVVSDYSDDIMGLTLDDIEYIRNRKENSSSPESSLHSSCSNLNYCGSSISALDGEYVLSKPYRKSSNCSSCSILSDEEEEVTLQPQKKEVSGMS